MRDKNVTKFNFSLRSLHRPLQAKEKDQRLSSCMIKYRPNFSLKRFAIERSTLNYYLCLL